MVEHVDQAEILGIDEHIEFLTGFPYGALLCRLVLLQMPSRQMPFQWGERGFRGAMLEEYLAVLFEQQMNAGDVGPGSHGAPLVASARTGARKTRRFGHA